MADTKLIRVNADVADEAAMRLFGFAAVAKAINVALEAGDNDALRCAPDALTLLAADIDDFAVALDVAVWSNAKRRLDTGSIARGQRLKGAPGGAR